MKKNILRKGLATGIIILFIGMSITPSTGITELIRTTMLSSNGDILYVGGTGEGNYTKIQDAIDNASEGDTVFVFDESSPYYENLRVFKSINIIGENRDTTVIDGNYKDTVVYISGNDVNVSGFTIKNCKRPHDNYYYCVVKIISSDNVSIKNNIISIGDIHSSIVASVYLGDSSNSTIEDNIIFEKDLIGCSSGILINVGSHNNIISGNEITKYHWAGVSCDGGYNIISENYIHDIESEGLEINGQYNEILYNKIEYCPRSGICINEGTYSIISGNIIQYNGGAGWFGCGIMLGDFYLGGYNNIVSGNDILYNNPTGIVVSGLDNIITKNNFIGNYGEEGPPEETWGSAYFYYPLKMKSFLIANYWWRNYWDGTRILPKIIFGRIFADIYPWYNIDWRPALKPYDIGV